jgi:hypothetical protein
MLCICVGTCLFSIKVLGSLWDYGKWGWFIYGFSASTVVTNMWRSDGRRIVLEVSSWVRSLSLSFVFWGVHGWCQFSLKDLRKDSFVCCVWERKSWSLVHWDVSKTCDEVVISSHFLFFYSVPVSVWFSSFLELWFYEPREWMKRVPSACAFSALVCWVTLICMDVAAEERRTRRGNNTTSRARDHSL